LPRLLYVVRRDQQSLYDYLRQSFAGEPDVEIVLDRRWAERRFRERAAASWERRNGERRLREKTQRDLHDLGYAIVILPD